MQLSRLQVRNISLLYCRSELKCRDCSEDNADFSVLDLSAATLILLGIKM